MPNGGVPINLVIKPKDSSDWIVHVNAYDIAVHSRDEWNKRGPDRVTTFRLSEGEAAAWADFVDYWLPSDRRKGPLHVNLRPHVDYDY